MTRIYRVEAVETARRPVLIVEDDPELRSVLGQVLIGADYPVLEAETGQAAVDIVTESEVGLVLLDIHLPDLMGWDVLEGMQRHDIETPVVIISIDSRVNDKLALKMGAVTFLPKPFSVDELLSVVAQAHRDPPSEASH